MTDKELWAVLWDLVSQGKTDDEIIQHLVDLLGITPKEARALLARMRAKYPDLEADPDTPKPIGIDDPFLEEDGPDQDEPPKPW